ncbi:MAG TPA: CoA transferase [Dehalococcoidia bacterium]|nr:CoA transferase [Dehalococcoidia bacterium]
MPLPLEGYRILEVTMWQQGTAATAQLADMGAEVIKIEAYSNPDPGRGLGALAPNDAPFNAYFDTLNRGKKSITLELRTEQGMEIFWKLAESSDVFHNNLRGGAMERLGITYETLTERNPDIIYSSASGWGHLGPERHVGAMDTLAQARGGFMSVTGEGPDSQPQPAGFPQADHVGAVISGYGIALALLGRERFGEGQEVNTSLYGSQMCIQTFGITAAIWNGESRGPTRRQDRSPTWTHYEAGDGKWFMIGALPPDKWWPQICEVIGAPELAQGKYATAADRLPIHAEVVEQVDAIFQTKTRDEWMELFHANNVLAQPVLDYIEIGQDEQAWANGYLVNVKDDEGRDWPVVGSPVNLSKTPAKIEKLGPQFGEHTEELLLGAGYSWDDISAFRDAGAFGEPA